MGNVVGIKYIRRHFPLKRYDEFIRIMTATFYRYRVTAFLLFAFSLSITGAPSYAHEIDTAVAQVNLQKDHSVRVILRVSLETLLTGTGNLPTGSDSADHGDRYQELRALKPVDLEQKAKTFLPEFLQSIHIDTEQRPVDLTLDSIFIPTLDNTDVMRESEIQFLGKLPENTKTLYWQWDEINGPVILRVDGAQGEELYSDYLQAGDRSIGITITDGATLSYRDVIKNYIHSGFIHIIPRGLDHIVFVLGLFLFSPRWRPLLMQVTVFTLAHTLTLALGSTGYLRISPDIVEPLIALSIVVVALENIWWQKINKFRLLVIFVFGLLHGLGFASVLGDVGLSNTHFITALLSFNVGVELGQFAVLALALICTFWCVRKRWYRSVVTIPGSLAIAAIGGYWFLERIL